MVESTLHTAFIATQDTSVALELALADGLRSHGQRVSFLCPSTPGAAHLLRRAGEGGRGRARRWNGGEPIPRALLERAMRFARLRAFVDPDVTPAWLDVRLELLALRSRALRAALEDGEVDRVALWSGWHPEARAAHLWAGELGIPCLHLENGLLPGRLQADFEGVNAGASFAGQGPGKWPAPRPGVERWCRGAYRRDGLGGGIPVTPAEVGRLASLVHRSLARPPRLARVRRLLASGGSPAPTGRVEPPDGPYVLLALQVPDDTQILLWSERTLWDPAALVAPVRHAVRRVCGEGVRLAVKPHPLDRSWRRVAEAAARTPGCLLARGGVGAWIEGARAVVVLNSSVGLEAVVRDRPVVTLAQSAYEVPGVVQRARGLGGLMSALDRALHTPRSGEATAALLGLLALHAGIPGGREWLAPETVPALAALLAAGRHPWMEASVD